MKAPDLTIRIVGGGSRTAFVFANSEAGQDHLDSAFDFLAEQFDRGFLILELPRVRTLIANAAPLRVLLDVRGFARC